MYELTLTCNKQKQLNLKELKSNFRAIDWTVQILAPPAPLPLCPFTNSGLAVNLTSKHDK